MNTKMEIRGHHLYRVSWSAIFAGAFVGLGLGFLLHLYGLAISLSAFSASTHTASTITMGGLLGMVVGVIIAMGTAGFVAGYLGRYHYYQVQGGVIYGFICWSVTLLMSALIAAPLMSYISSYDNSLTSPIVITTPKIKINTLTTNPTQPTRAKSEKNTTPVAEVSPTDMAWGGWILFGLFFLGALSSCIGACIGMDCKREEL